MKLTPETIQKTRQWYADNARECARVSQPFGSGALKHANGFYVNEHARYVVEQEKRANECLAGKWDHTLAFQQRAIFIQTGVCHPILP